MRAVNTRCILVYVALLLANAALADGTYQRTKDGKTLVWNSYPRPSEVATWSGNRDPDGYATGYGTLTWYAVKRVTTRRSRVPAVKDTAVARLSGNMIRGKFNGSVVNIDATGKTFHCTFVDGRKASDWAAGPAPDASPTGISEQQSNERVPRAELVEAPAEGPSPVPDHTPVVASAIYGATRKSSQDLSKPAAREVPSPASNSLQSLTKPPSSLRTNVATGDSVQTSTPPARPRLTTAEVIGLGDAEARTQGYDLGEYQRPRVNYISANDAWLVVYDQKGAPGRGGISKHISVRVEDKTKKASVVAETGEGLTR
jgi:hypothetical protein